MGIFSKKKDLFDALFSPATAVVPTAPGIPMASVDALAAWDAPVGHGYFNGDKFSGGFGETLLLTPDYWTLRARSAQLFRANMYARGLIRRLVTNEINTGLFLACEPEESVLGVPADSLADWSEMVENRWAIWTRSGSLCDLRGQQTFGELQAEARREALIEGDILVVLSQDDVTALPRVRLVPGGSVQSPLSAELQGDRRISHGVETDENGKHIAYWIVQDDRTRLRLPAYGERSGRRQAWLQYGTDKRRDDVRGEPLLGIVAQSLREIDRYKDSALRKAVINSMVAMFIKKTEDRMGSKPLTGGATRRGTETATTGAGARSYQIQEQIPGMVLETLQVGEEPVPMNSNGTDEAFGVFEEAIIQSIAWANEIPPEILRLSFSSNYSASQAAISEFTMYLNRCRATFASGFCQPIYEDWLLSEVLSGRIAAPGLIAAWRDPAQFDRFGAWIMSDWGGHIKPAIDLVKRAKGYTLLIEQGLITRDRAARELTGTKFSKNAKKLGKENGLLSAANKPLAEPEVASFPVSVV